MSLRSPRKNINLAAAAAAAAAVVYCGSVATAQNIALRKPVVDGSNTYPNLPFYQGQFRADQVTDGITHEAVQNGYWLGDEDNDPAEYPSRSPRGGSRRRSRPSYGSRTAAGTR